ncbi:MAG: VTT domain-containing protein [Rhodocyclales bacterium]|nr:VTT domain-containing protein [Rhodocyclales bacterium]
MSFAKLMRFTLITALAAGIALAAVYREQFSAAALQAWMQEAGVVAPLIFMALYAAATVLFLPGSVLTITGGALFGPVWGTFYSLTGATVGATLAFLIARYLASDWVARKAGGRLKQLIEGVETESWRFIAFVRLVPLFPFNLLNYALGLTRIKLSHFIITSYICMLPGAIAFTYLGHAGREAAEGSAGSIQKGLLALGLLALIVFLPRLIRRMRRAPMLGVEDLKRKLDAGEDLLVLDVRGVKDFCGEQGHIAAALSIPLEELPRRATELDAYLKRPIAIVCRTDKRSATAAQLLSAKGFSDIRVTRGGMTEWNRSGFPVER